MTIPASTHRWPLFLSSWSTLCLISRISHDPDTCCLYYHIPITESIQLSEAHQKLLKVQLWSCNTAFEHCLCIFLTAYSQDCFFCPDLAPGFFRDLNPSKSSIDLPWRTSRITALCIHSSASIKHHAEVSFHNNVIPLQSAQTTTQEIMCQPLSSQSLPCVLPRPFFPPFVFDPALMFKWSLCKTEKGTIFFLFSFLFSSDPIHLAAAPLLDPSEGAARNRHLGWQKGQNFTVCQLCALWSYPGKIVYLNILGRAFYFSDWNVAHCLSFSLTSFIPPVLCHHLLTAFPASYLNLFAKPTPFFIAAALLFETSKFQV